MRALLILLLAISLSGCGSISSFLGTTLADYIPAWAGGLPKDAPPRPDDPRYQQYLEEQRAKRDVSKPGDQTADKSSETSSTTSTEQEPAEPR